jgi:DNA replication protein DnaC
MEPISRPATLMANLAAQRAGAAPAQRVTDLAGPDGRATPDGERECQTCKGMRFIAAADGGMKACPDCGVANQWRAKSLDKYSSQTGQARTFEAFDLRANPQARAAFEAARRWAMDPQGWLLIYGQPGNGKSHLCAAVHQTLGERGQASIFVTMPDLTASLKECLGDDAPEPYQHRLERYQRAPVLILDDVGSERRTDWVDEVMVLLVDYRYRNRLPTLLASNVDPEDEDVFDFRVIDRWCDVNLCTIIHNPAPSYRRKSRKTEPQTEARNNNGRH